MLVFVAGPNGSGKSTFVETYLVGLGLPYVNADRIARALREAGTEASADEIDRLAFTQAEEFRRSLLAARLSFCTETVFSDPAGSKMAFLREARTHGFVTFMFFIGLESPALSTARVLQRVRLGGHDVPEEKLRARFPRTLTNLRAAIPLVDEARLFDNSSSDAPYRLVAVYADGHLVSRYPPLPRWTRGLPGL